jgi:16S rRNA (cytidine1402-2'-O)-methyltransferase
MGKLFIVPTPIGNLGDITFRAVETLKSVDFILTEDTRQSIKLLKHYEIRNTIKSFHQHNEHRISAKIAEELAETTIQAALVSDAGMPGISDPGFLLVRDCRKLNVEVECLPGPTAFLPALIQSGFPADRFCFEGFLPHKKGRSKRLEELKEEKRTLIFYEAPHRLLNTLEQFSLMFGTDRKCSVSRELTKIYAETINADLGEMLNIFRNRDFVKGEFVIIIYGNK